MKFWIAIDYRKQYYIESANRFTGEIKLKNKNK